MLTYFPEQLYKCAIVSYKKEAMNTTHSITHRHTLSVFMFQNWRFTVSLLLEVAQM